MTFLVNLFLVLIGAGILLAFSKSILRLLATDAIARECVPLLPSVLSASALLALGVSGTYAMLALGRVFPVTLINIAAAIALLLVVVFFLPVFGVTAIIAARLAFALVSMLVYVPLFHELRIGAFRLDRFAPREATTEEA